MLIRELMNTRIVVITPTISIKQAAVVLERTGLNAIPVVDNDGKLMGLVSQIDLVKAVAVGNISTLQNKPVKNIMTPPTVVLQDTLNLRQLQQQVDIRQCSLFPVVDTFNRPIGIVSQTDLINYLSEDWLLLAGEMKAVLNSVYNGVIAINTDGIITLFNDAAAAMTGLSKEKVLGHYIDEVIPHTQLLRVSKTGMIEMNQYLMIGDCKVVSTYSPILKNKTIVGAVATLQDITKFQEIAAELENVKNLKSTLESAIESFFEGIVVVDKKGQITMMNRAYGAFLNVNPNKVIGKHVTDIIPNTRMHLVAQDGKAEVTDLQKINTHNSVVTRIPIIKDGETIGAIGKVLFEDMKDLKTLSNKLNKLQFELEYYKEQLHEFYSGKFTLENIIGNSPQMQELKSIALKAAKGTSSVLILGESGTGKEVFAHAIHNASIRRSGPFIKINCAAVPENLLESELFGYEEGAFTGAKKGGKPGKFELSNGGTIFLDEIGDMALPMQAKLLRVLQEKEIDRVGGTKTIPIDIRVIAATNRDLETMIEQGDFRQDLYYRLNIITLNIPPLRERYEDISILCSYLLNKILERTPHSIEGISPAVMDIFLHYSWPGNIRELENVLERIVNIFDDEKVIKPEHLPATLKKSQKQITVPKGLPDLTDIVEEAEKEAIINALAATRGNKSKAAKLLGINRSGFYERLHKYNIEL